MFPQTLMSSAIFAVVYFRKEPSTSSSIAAQKTVGHRNKSRHLSCLDILNCKRGTILHFTYYVLNSRFRHIHVCPNGRIYNLSVFIDNKLKSNSNCIIYNKLNLSSFHVYIIPEICSHKTRYHHFPC